MRAIILAGGLGTRLAAVVDNVPKPMAPVAGRPFLTYILDLLLDNGVTDVTLCVGFRKDCIIDYFHKSYKGIRIDYAEESEPLGTGGAVINALKLHPEHKQVYLLNGDTLFQLPLLKLLSSHNSHNADITIALKPMLDTDRYGAVTLNSENRITGFSEKAHMYSGLINGGVYLINPSALLALDLPRKFSFEHELLTPYLRTLRIFGALFDDFFIDIGIPEDYVLANSLLPL